MILRDFNLIPQQPMKQNSPNGMIFVSLAEEIHMFAR
jgi:hypothetical protein